MSRALVLRHHVEDSPGLVGEALVARGFSVQVVMMDEVSPSPSVDEVDLLVILGSKHSVYDAEVEEAWFGRELELVGEADRRSIPIFGICFGAQALCRYFGGTVAPSREPEVGWYEVQEENGSRVGAGPWFEWHFDACTLPDAAQVWASNPRAVQAFAIGRHVGVQFHPEIDEHQLAQWMGAGGAADARALGLDPEELIRRTARETPSSRGRVADLVDVVLRHTQAARGSDLVS
jgi:GMP synthase-like glutamine amidotransferase